MAAVAGQSFIRADDVNEAAEQIIQRLVTATAGTPGYTVTTAGANSIVLTRKYTPQWAIIVAIVGALLFLLGLLALLVKETETLTITATPTPGGSRVNINGVATPDMVARLTAALAAAGASVSGAPVAPLAAAVPAAPVPGAPVAPVAPPVAATQPAPAAAAPQAGWHADPMGRFELRYWDGTTWTEHVSRGGQPSTDPV